MVRGALASGAGLRKFGEMIRHQGGDSDIVSDLSRLPQATSREMVPAPASGHLQRLDAELVGRASMLLGAGREKADDAIDPAAGILLHRKPGDAVSAGDPLLELHYNDNRRVVDAQHLVAQAIVIGDAPPVSPLVLDHIT